MSGYTEQAARFKKTQQVVNGGENNETVGNFNDEAMKTFGGREQNQTQEPRSANSKIERDLQEKGYTTRDSDETLDEYQELEKKVEKRTSANN